MEQQTPKVYQAIANVAADLGKVGISKSRQNQQQHYQFRGIDDVFAALSPLLAKHKLCILPRVLRHRVTDKQTKSGGTLFYTTIKCDFDFVSCEDGSKHTVTTFGEAMDSGDKSTNKAMSAAYKYAAFQAFCIPTEGEDNDADATTHEVASQPKEKPRPKVDANFDAVLVGKWHKWIEDGPTLLDANNATPRVLALPAAERELVWAKFQAYCQASGWEFHEGTKVWQAAEAVSV